MGDEPRREMCAATKAMEATEGGLWSHKSLSSHSDNFAFEGPFEPPAATRHQPQKSNPQLSFSTADTATKATEGTKGAGCSATGDATSGSEEAEDWAAWFTERAVNRGVGRRSRAEAERVA